MKTSIIIFIFLLQALFISAFTMNETQVPADTTSDGKSLVVLLDGNEIFGEIISQTEDSLTIITDKEKYIQYSIKQIRCIIKMADSLNPDILKRSNKYFMFTLPDKTLRFGQILSFDGIYYRVKLDNNSVTGIDSYKFLSYNFPASKIKNIKWLNAKVSRNYRIFLEDAGTIDCQIISQSTDKLKLLVQSQYLVNIPANLFEFMVPLVNIADTSLSITPTQIIILRNDYEIIGKIILKNKDSVLIKVEPGLAVQISNSEIDNIYRYEHYAKNVVYIDAATLIFVGYVNANYELMVNPYMSIRFGAGFGYKAELSGPSYNCQGVSLMINFLPGKKYSKFEFGIGASYNKEENANYSSDIKTKFGIAFAIGYRYQHKHEGMLFRIGCSNLVYGGGIHLSLGYAL